MSLPHVPPDDRPEVPPPSSSHPPPAAKRALVCGVRATGLVTQLAHRLAGEGAHVTLALRHPEEAAGATKHLRAPRTGSGGTLDAFSSPLDVTSLSAVRAFASAINSSQAPLDLLVLDTQELCSAAAMEQRWYTPEGLSGAAQTGFLAPAVLLHLLQPTLAACGTSVLLTASIVAALLAYTRHLAEQLQAEGVTAAAVDVGILSDQPLQGSLVRKLPVLLLPSPAGAAHLLADVAIDACGRMNDEMAAAAPAGSEPDSGSMPQAARGVASTRLGSATVSTDKHPGSSNATNPYRYLSRGLLASPLVTALDHAGRSSWPSKALRSALTPLFQLTAGMVLTMTTLADWPVRALLLGPAGLLPALASRLGPLGAWASGRTAQLQRLVPGVVGVPPGAVPRWVEVAPPGAVLDADLGWRLAALVRCYAELAQA